MFRATQAEGQSASITPKGREALPFCEDGLLLLRRLCRGRRRRRHLGRGLGTCTHLMPSLMTSCAPRMPPLVATGAPRLTPFHPGGLGLGFGRSQQRCRRRQS